MHPETLDATDRLLAGELSQYTNPAERINRIRTYWILEFFLTKHGVPTYCVSFELEERKAVDAVIAAEARDNVRVVCAQLAYDSEKGGFYGDDE